MNKDARDIRKSIAQRKKQRELGGDRNRSTSVPISNVQEEEKHGYLPFFSGDEKQSATSQIFSAFVFKAIIAAILFFSVAIVYRVDSQLFETPKQWVNQAITQEFQFASVNKWYQEKFGEPFAFLPQNPPDNGGTQPAMTEQFALPVNGTISESFQKNGQGIVISTDDAAQVHASDGGTVEFVGKKADTQNTVIIQHADGSKSYYGFLESMDVTQYEQVTHGQVIGTTSSTTEGQGQSFYFAIQQGNQFVDPIKVIQVDEQP
ncbi:M23 family metallopeptidase [Pontibacillus yanchengensis]|uniref:Stage IV sporulation protein FA n=1 Tax=Pontibacillus yanchengensis Y32 TaxID=1385514 RepID=A0A0A2TXB8_9BACI|nr:M23 family metallopeptidase [Pontibacillus yanchengensis]KGP73890.1 stage IV sporulation protein FA [Pontibacillus yanchengensis Y32]